MIHVMMTLAAVLAECLAAGNYTNDALTIGQDVITRAGSGGVWRAEEPRTRMAIMSSVLSVEQGRVDRAKEVLSMVLRLDPDNSVIKPL